MKRLVAIFSVLVAGTLACHSDEVRTDLLYQTWEQTQYITAEGKSIPLSAHPSNIITFRKNGTMLYGADGTHAVCCNPVRFNRKGGTLDLVDIASIPIPADVPTADCSYVDCIPSDSTWQITRLNPSQMVIKKSFRGMATYRPYR